MYTKYRNDVAIDTPTENRDQKCDPKCISEAINQISWLILFHQDRLCILVEGINESEDGTPLFCHVSYY